MDKHHKTQRWLGEEVNCRPCQFPSSRPERIPSYADIMLLSSWPQPPPSQVDQSANRAWLRDQFDRVVEADWRSLYREAIRAGSNGQDAEDIVQEALLRAYQSLEKMNKTQLAQLRVHSWLRTLTASTVKRTLATRSERPDRA